MRRRFRQFALLINLFAIVLFLLRPINVLASDNKQNPTPDPRVENLLNRMSPEEKIGQLFLVTFYGTDITPDTPIYDLIVKYHIGGVILKANNDNFVSGDEAITQAIALTTKLQTIEYQGSQNSTVDPFSGELVKPTYIPLFIGISQDGDGYPNDQILHGMTQLPSQMALGATWNPELAKETGKVLGKELSQLGINLIFGPSLDIVETPHPFENSDLGVKTFGGDPYWVSKMGQEYIAGLHIGSENRLAVVATHFPGLGSSDRIPIDEVATVRKSLDQLKQIELAPFFAVTGDAPSPYSTVDALLTAHIRYQGFQGNIRASTKPISFDPQAFDLLMNLLQLSSWRSNNGIMISDDLGVPAVRRFYDPSDQGFNARRPVLDAFLAGNDILFVGGITEENSNLENNSSSYQSNLIDILEFFSQKYREDPAFASRVDQSVYRILTLKYKIYEFFSLSQVIPPTNPTEEFGDSSQLVFEVARQSATLINPPIEELNTVLPNPPSISDKIVFFTDSYPIQQCSNCEVESNIPQDALMKAIQRLYGPSAGGQILNYNLSSYTFADAIKLLDDPSNSSHLLSAVKYAHWIVFLMLDANPQRPESLAVQRILSERSDLLRNKNIVVFAANAPYYLDATEISKLTAYYGLYSKAPPFIEIAARLLFKEIPTPIGSSPVSIPGIGYDLRSVTSPDPSKPFKLSISIPNQKENQEENNTSENTDLKEFNINDTIIVTTETILDHNGHPVPDQTPVQFTIIQNEREEYLPSVETVNGIASIKITLEQPGPITIKAISESAYSEELAINVIGELSETPSPTNESTVTATEEAITTQEATETTPTPEPAIQEEHIKTDITDWFIAVLLSILAGLAIYRFGAIIGKVRWGIQWGFSAVIGGILFYILLSLNFPLSTKILLNYGRLGVVVSVLIGILIGWGVTLTIELALNKK